ncbi:1234_t:CDS:2, partial [Scutellospora calospora]
MAISSFKDLARGYEKLLQNGYQYDVIIRAGEGNNFKEIHAHSLILSARSSYFNAALSSNWAKKEGNYYVFTKPNIPANLFEIILKYLYTTEIVLAKFDHVEAIKLLVAADELLLQNVTDK